MLLMLSGVVYTTCSTIDDVAILQMASYIHRRFDVDLQGIKFQVLRLR